MREWLSGGAQPCQGWGRGFDPRLALHIEVIRKNVSGLFFLNKISVSILLLSFSNGG